MRKLIIIAALVVSTTALVAVASPAQAATPKERNLARQVQTLKAQKTKLTRERNAARAQRAAARSSLATAQQSIVKLTRQRDAARSSLATAQFSTSAAVSTMTPQQINSLVLPEIYDVYKAWSSSPTLAPSALGPPRTTSPAGGPASISGRTASTCT